ncbi:MAG: L-histidine N(alpha)-methyltransferase [Thermoanaerobaculia bacterium]|nr:L-histidine N(alpha)-methyltransferase [Thermoanaerobaculia bacterium]
MENPRFVLEHLEPAEHRSSFAEDVKEGLTAEPKALQPKYFYDELGSLLFEAICLLPEYYVTRAEAEILERHADEMAATLGPVTRVLELGSGTAKKTRHLLAALLDGQATLEYVPVDISATAIESSAADLLTDFPGLTIHALVSDYPGALAAFGRHAAAGPGPTLALFLGSTLGNLDPAAQLALLTAIRAVLVPGDHLLLGVDLDKSEAILLPAYDDPLGVTAAFNKNLLLRINRELGADFDLDAFAHRVRYLSQPARIEMHLESRQDQTVTLAALGRLEVTFRRGETLFTEASHKFDTASVGHLAAAAGFRLERTWTDRKGCFASILLGCEKDP